jgi:Ca-activated chloride channel family protein
LIKPIKVPGTLRSRQLLIILRTLALVVLILAMARPQSGRKLVEVTSEGIDIVLAIDTSRSMEAMDFTLDGKPAPRLEVVKRVVEEFIKNQSGNRLGLVVFGSEAFTQCPLTLDYGVVLSFVKRLKTGMAGDATAIGSALSVATSRIKDIPSKSRVVILLTDGASNAGPVGPEEAAEAAKTFGVKVYTVGIGSEGLAPMPRRTILGTFYDAVKVDFDEATLKKIAETTSGTYFRATDTDTLQQIYDTIATLEKTKKKVKEHMDYHELFVPFVMAGLLLLLVEIVLANTRLRKLP